MENVVYKKLNEIKKYKNNPRRNEEAIQYVANSIKEFGFKVPIVIDKDNVIVCGHTRRDAAETLGLEEIPCIIADDLTDEQIRKFRIADNKVAEIAEWDDAVLRNEMSELQDILDMTIFGYNNFEIHSIVDDIEPDDFDDELIAKYSCNADNYLLMKTLIIRYEDEEEDKVRKLLKVKPEDRLKVGYVIEEILNNFK